MEIIPSITEKKDWLRISEASEMFGLNRNIIYDLINHQEIKSSLIKRRGSTRGVRLISRSSLNDYIETQITIAQ